MKVWKAADGYNHWELILNQWINLLVFHRSTVWIAVRPVGEARSRGWGLRPTCLQRKSLSYSLSLPHSRSHQSQRPWAATTGTHTSFLFSMFLLKGQSLMTRETRTERLYSQFSDASLNKAACVIIRSLRGKTPISPGWRQTRSRNLPVLLNCTLNRM